MPRKLSLLKDGIASRFLRRFIAQRIKLARKKRDKLSAEAEPEMKEIYLQTLGMLVVAWSEMENGLAEIIRVLFEAGGKSSIQSVQPLALSGKIDFLKKAYRAGGMAHEFQSDGVKMIASVKAVKGLRDDFIHGLSRRLPRSAFYSVRRLRYTDTGSYFVKSSYHDREVLDAIKTLCLLSQEVENHLRAVERRFSDSGNNFKS
jgi:hypothetical protein